MPIFTVLRLPGSGPDRLVLTPAGVQDTLSAGAVRLGTLRVPLSTRILSLSPTILFLPGFGEIDLERLIGGPAVPTVEWTPEES